MNIAIVGGGLSGTLLACYLLEEHTPVTIYLFERDYRQLNTGVAYASASEGQLLNVRASAMNIFGMPESSFYQWLKKQPGMAHVAPEDFVERRWFGFYLKEIFEARVQEARHSKVCVITDEVVDMLPDGDRVDVLTSADHTYRVDVAVLATGVLPPSDPFTVKPEVHLSRRYHAHPWAQEYWQHLNPNDHVFLIGTGLTMLDHAAKLLRAHKQIRVTALSRRGFVPLPHALYAPYSFADFPVKPTDDINALVASIRACHRQHQQHGLDWRCLVDMVRSQVPMLWAALSDTSKQRFLRHVKPYWEIHRHRAPAEVLNLLSKANEEGRFRVLKGRLQDVSLKDAQTLGVTVQSRQERSTIDVSHLLNCSGLQHSIEATDDILLRNLMHRGLIRPDVLGLGIVTNDAGAVGAGNIFCLGALRRPAEFECTAAREIGEQAFKLSKRLRMSMENNIIQ
jgi:uncharacterized NAD(P)/FAD-binding protein YdhS